MGNLFSFLTGVLVGVAVGLLYAPMSGEELRAEIRTEAEVELKKVEAEWNKRLKEVNKSLEATRQEVMAYMNKSQETQETVEEEAE
jgi:gas vesicle protein